MLSASSPSGIRVSKREGFLVAATIICYAGLVVCLWGWYGLHSGLGYETGLVWTSETSTFFQGFIYSDPLRPFTSLFYHLSYLLAKAAGVDGSFVPYQIVYAALWTARGVLVFLIVRRLLDGASIYAYVAGALTIFHASDSALNWVGQLNQFGFIFWTLLSFYFYVIAIQMSRRSVAAFALALAATACTGLSLWSYESPLPMVFAFPLLIMLLFSGIDGRKLKLTAIYYFAPIVYLTANIVRYLKHPSAGAYQISVLRSDWSPSALLGDWLFNIKASTFFWRWMDGMINSVPIPLLAVSIGASVAIFSIGVLVVTRLNVGNTDEPADRNKFVALTLLGFAMLAASFPVYLLLASAAAGWRTQLLAGPGTGIFLAGIAGIAASFVDKRAWGVTILIVLGSVVAAYGINASLKSGFYHRQLWEKHRSILAQVLQVAPTVRPGTIVVLTNVTPDVDVFGDNMWYDVALRLAYPGVPVAGLYFLPGGVAPPGASLKLRAEKWVETGIGFPTLIKDIPLSSTIFIEASANGQPRLLETVPDFLGVDATTAQRYRPRELVGPGSPSPLAIRRYSPIASP